MTLVLELPDAWKQLLGLDAGDVPRRVRQMLVLEGYREGRLSRGQAAEMLGMGYHEAEQFFRVHGAEQQASWEEQHAASEQLKSLLER